MLFTTSMGYAAYAWHAKPFSASNAQKPLHRTNPTSGFCELDNAQLSHKEVYQMRAVPGETVVGGAHGMRPWIRQRSGDF